MQKIDELRQEIKAFEDEIASLQQELTAISGIRSPQASSESSPLQVAQAVRQEVQKSVEQQPLLKGLRDAIAELTSRLVQKQSQLQELEAAELKKHRQGRITEGQVRLRSKFADVEVAAKSLQNLYFELKAIASEYEKDFSQINPPTTGGTVLNRNSLLNYERLMLPTIKEENQRFILSSKAIDIFEEEKRLLKQQQLENSRFYRLERQRELAEISRQKADEEARIEQEDRQTLLKYKTSQLAEYKDARRNRLAGLATANASDFDDAIAQLEIEIAKLQEPQG